MADLTQRQAIFQKSINTVLTLAFHFAIEHFLNGWPTNAYEAHNIDEIILETPFIIAYEKIYSIS